MSPKNLTFYETKKDQIILLDSSITYVNNKQFLVMNYVLDAKVTTVERQVYSIFDAIASTGGIMGVILQLFNFFIKDIQAFLYKKTMAQENFMVAQSD